MTQQTNEGSIMTSHTSMAPRTSAMENPSSHDHPKHGGNGAPQLWSAPAAKALAGSTPAPLSRLRSMPDMRKEEKRVSPHSPAGPHAKARAGRSPEPATHRGSFSEGPHSGSSGRKQGLSTLNIISEALLHSAPGINQHAAPPFLSLSAVPVKQPTPLEMLRLKKRAEKNKQVVEARAVMKQRLHEHAASNSFQNLTGEEQAAWSCGSRDIAGLSEADASREYALLSEEDGEFARLPAVPQVLVRHLPPAAAPTSSSIQYWASLDESNSLFCDGCDGEMPL